MHHNPPAQCPRQLETLHLSSEQSRVQPLPWDLKAASLFFSLTRGLIGFGMAIESSRGGVSQATAESVEMRQQPYHSTSTTMSYQLQAGEHAASGHSDSRHIYGDGRQLEKEINAACMRKAKRRTKMILTCGICGLEEDEDAVQTVSSGQGTRNMRSDGSTGAHFTNTSGPEYHPPAGTEQGSDGQSVAGSGAGCCDGCEDGD